MWCLKNRKKRLIKDSRPIQVPIELDLNQFCSDKVLSAIPSAIYSLNGIIFHEGPNVKEGFFTSKILTFNDF